MTIGDALKDLGALPSVLSADEQAVLDRDGYLVLPGILTAEQVAAMNAVLDRLAVEEGDRAGTEVHQEPGTVRLSNLVNKWDGFDICFSHPRVLSGIAQVLGGDLKLSSLNFRSALPGSGLQGLHCDWSGPVPAGDYHVCNSIWLLDDFSPENGATRVVPGSHQWEKTPQQTMEDASAPHPDEVVLTAPAGTVVIFNSHTWHGGTLNRSSLPRRGMHSYFCRREHPQQLDQRRWLDVSTVARLSEAQRVVLDI
jgi:ectoine hydroxylase-related dioxygenase (phytanoyl-CoA dioxygenase family)